MHTTKGMVKPGVVCPGVDQIGKSHLGNPSQALEVWGGDQVKNKFIGYPDKSVNWVIKNLKFVRSDQND
jgi:hypothetical protein